MRNGRKAMIKIFAKSKIVKLREESNKNKILFASPNGKNQVLQRFSYLDLRAFLFYFYFADRNRISS